MLAAFAIAALPGLTSCSNDDPGNSPYAFTTLGFQKISPELIGGPTAYGANLYPGATDQVTTGPIIQVYEDTYMQFPVNYGYNWNADFSGQEWGYSFYNGGFAASNWHNTGENSYENQLSAYNPGSPSGGNFVVATGYSSVTDPVNASLSDYDGCARIYVTDADGYTVMNPGVDRAPSGVAKRAYFLEVYICPTTYSYLTMLNGNDYAQALNETNKGWFKVQFISFDSNSPSAKPTAYVEAYLANFNPDLNGGYTGMLDGWAALSLQTLPATSVLVVNFVGSDTGEYGLNTPAYCALDMFTVAVEKGL